MRLGPGCWLNAQMQLLSWLGEDLHGESFLAEQRPQGRSVLVKVLSAETCRTPEYLERFRHTAERAMLLSHKNLAAVHAFGLLPSSLEPSIYDELGERLESGKPAASSALPGQEIPWLATDPIDGADLRSLLSEGLSPDALAPLLVPVADLLDRAVTLGLYHGELSPANLLLVKERDKESATERLVLVDLGLAKLMARDLLELPAPPGALCYRSPEQCQDGTQVEPASDRYALAAILFESVAGRPPFVSDNPRTLMQLHRAAPVPPLRTIAPRLHRAEALDAFFVRALAKEPAARFPSAMAMLEEFTLALSVPQKGARPAQKRRSPRWYRLSRGDDAAQCIDVVVGPRAVLGKQSECDVVCQALPSPEHDLITGTISREHAVLIWLDNRLSVLDQSSNGTYINDRRIGPRLTALPDGALVRLGEHLTVHVTLLGQSGGGDPGGLPPSEMPGALLVRGDRYAKGVPPTLMLWQNLPLPGSPIAQLGGALRFGQLWVAQRELWWSGHPTVVWQRQDHTPMLGPAPLRDGDTLTDREVVIRIAH
jgi:serine/threonine protein kinase